jgi:hypothetical protein
MGSTNLSLKLPRATFESSDFESPCETDMTPPAFELDVFVRDAPHVSSRRSMSAAPLSGLIARIRRNRLFGVTHNVNRRSHPRGEGLADLASLVVPGTMVCSMLRSTLLSALRGNSSTILRPSGTL